MDRFLTITNNEGEIASTNYWETEASQKGLFYLSTNAGVLRLLVPVANESWLPDMTEGVKEVVLTRGRFNNVNDVVEIMFEDGSPSPFALHIAHEQLDRLWLREDERKPHRFTIWAKDRGKIAEFTCWLRRAANLPYMKPRTP